MRRASPSSSSARDRRCCVDYSSSLRADSHQTLFAGAAPLPPPCTPPLQQALGQRLIIAQQLVHRRVGVDLAMSDARDGAIDAIITDPVAESLHQRIAEEI